jgi:hypothetical protein
MEVRGRMLGLSARTDRADRLALDDLGCPLHACGAEMRERHGVAIGGLDRDTPAAHRHGSGEGDRAAGRREDGSAGGCADVDAAMLARRVGVRSEHELLQYRSVRRPGPCSRSGRHDEHSRKRRDQSSKHQISFVVLSANNAENYLQCPLLSIWTTRTCRKAPSATNRSGARRPTRPGGGRPRRRQAR